MVAINVSRPPERFMATPVYGSRSSVNNQLIQNLVHSPLRRKTALELPRFASDPSLWFRGPNSIPAIK